MQPVIVHNSERNILSGIAEVAQVLYWHYFCRLLLDSRVVDVPMAYNSTFVMLSSLKPLLFSSLKNELRFSDNAGAEDPGIQ
jgi:hypothetical protein